MVRATSERGDLDNLLKGFLDAGNGILWHDDAQIVELRANKVYEGSAWQWKAPGVEITFAEVGG